MQTPTGQFARHHRIDTSPVLLITSAPMKIPQSRCEAGGGQSAGMGLRFLSWTDPIPHDAIAVRIGMDDALAKKIRTALVDLDKSEAGRRVIANSKKKLTGHVIAEDSVFDVVRRTAKIAGM